MVEVTDSCPTCEALTSLERDGYLANKSVTVDPLDGYTSASTTGNDENEDGVEFVCIGDADDDPNAGCGRTFYLNFVTFENGREVQSDGRWLEDDSRFDFLR